MIELRNVNKTYKVGGIRTHVLKQVSLCVAEGELLAISGASGSGKSTLMNIIGLLDKPDSGAYYLQQHNTAHLHEDEAATLRNRSIGFVFQQFNLLPRLTVMHNVALPLTYQASGQDIKEQALQALSRVGMEAYIHHKPTQLSGGQQQRVAIARALVTKPRVILADEPTGALDTRTGQEVMDLFLSLNAQQCTFIIVTHDEGIASQCKRRIHLVDGDIV